MTKREIKNILPELGGRKHCCIAVFLLMILPLHLFCFCEQKTAVPGRDSNEIYSELSADSIQNQLVGIWGQNPSENAFFKISKDSIYYVDNDQTFPYVFIKGSFICLNENRDTIYSCKVSLPSRDSVIMEEKTTGEKTIFIRFP